MNKVFFWSFVSIVASVVLLYFFEFPTGKLTWQSVLYLVPFNVVLFWVGMVSPDLWTTRRERYGASGRLRPALRAGCGAASWCWDYGMLPE